MPAGTGDQDRVERLARSLVRPAAAGGIAVDAGVLCGGPAVVGDDELSKGTIDTVMAASDEELGLAALLGQRPGA
jgi:hypothetical protein